MDMKKILFFHLLIYTGFCLAQYPGTPIQQAIPDTAWDHQYFAIRVGFSNYMYGKYPDPLFFQYKNSDLIIQKTLAFKTPNPMHNLNLGYECSLKNRLYMEGNWSMNPWTGGYFIWNMSAGAGYMYSLTKDERLLLCPYMNLSVGSYRYKFFDQHLDGTIIANGHNLGYINSILFIDRTVCATPALKLIYQYRRISLYASVGYCIPFMKKEMISFKQTDVGGNKVSCSASDFILDYDGHAVHKDIIEDTRFLEASAGMILRINDVHHVQKIKPVQW